MEDEMLFLLKDGCEYASMKFQVKMCFSFNFFDP